MPININEFELVVEPPERTGLDGERGREPEPTQQRPPRAQDLAELHLRHYQRQARLRAD